MLRYAIEAANIKNKAAFFEMVETTLPKATQDNVMTLAEQLRSEGYNAGIHQGMEQGRQEGVQQGMRQGEHHLFLRLLKKKFSAIPEKYFNRIDAADEEDLLLWGERLIMASTLQDIFEDE